MCNHVRPRSDRGWCRVVSVEGHCTTGGGWLRRGCGAPAVGVCVYCGHSYCVDHGDRGKDYLEVCTRSACRAKVRDMQAHHKWKQRVALSNHRDICAQDECRLAMEHECGRCLLRFCAAHVKQGTIVDRSSRPPRRSLTLLCAHCLDRRRLWD